MDRYKILSGCSYYNGQLKLTNGTIIPETFLSNLTVETFGRCYGLLPANSIPSPLTYDSRSSSCSRITSSNSADSSGARISSMKGTLQDMIHYQKYDTVIVMNVLVYALDAFEFLSTVHNALKPGGLLLFHDRYFDNWAKSSKCKTAGFTVNVLQVTSIFEAVVLKLYSIMHLFLRSIQFL